MFIIRPIEEKDFDTYYRCAELARGMTSLPKDKIKLGTLLTRSLVSFSKNVNTPQDEYYLFVLEDRKTLEVCGVSAILATKGYHTPFPIYQVTEKKLYPDFITKGPSELCSLYLFPTHRKGGLGKLLSLSRLHFIATFPERFHSILMADMRGYIDEKKESPFWKSLGGQKMSISFEEADNLIIDHHPNIEKFRLHESLSLSDIDEPGRNAIGKTHPNTIPALKMLIDEGFSWKGAVDIVDAGPLITTHVKNMKVLKEGKLLPLIGLREETADEPMYIISNNRLDFRAGLAQVTFIKDKGIFLTQKAIEGLKVNLGDTLRITAQHHE